MRTGKIKEGFGVTKYLENGSEYHGEYKKGVKEGPGKIIYNNGSVFQGFFDKSEKSGQGIYTRADGLQFKGEWRNGELRDDIKVDVGNGWQDLEL